MFDNLLNRGLTGGDTDPMLQQAFFEAPNGCIQPLVEINRDAYADYFLDLFQPKVRCQHVVIEQYSPALVADKLP